MAEPLPKRTLDSAVDPAKIVQQTFELERRGFDQRQVQAYLRAVADSLRDAQAREAEMRTRLGKAIRRAETAEKTLRDSPATDESELTRQIGEEVTSVLDAARAAGQQRISAAEKSAERLMANAKTEATQIRAAAETIMDERREAADAAAADIVAEGSAEAEQIRAQARASAEAMLSEAANRVARARDECDGLVREAEEARGQILEDMERRRREARAQVERLRVGRDRLLRSYDVVRRTLEETTAELKSSLKEAKVKGDTAARLVAAEPLAGRDQLEAELADAKMIGAVKVSTPKVLRSPALPRPLDPPQVPNIDLRTESAPTPRKPAVAQPSRAPDAAPRPPAVAPTLKPTPPDVMGVPGGPVDEPIDAELAALEDDDLAVIDPSDEVEEVVAMPSGKQTATTKTANAKTATTKTATTKEATAKTATTKDATTKEATAKTATTKDATAKTAGASARATEATGGAGAKSPTGEDKVAAPGLFAALRAQKDGAGVASDATGDDDTGVAEDTTAAEDDGSAAADVASQRDAIIAESASQLEKRLKRALADEQNELLAGIRAANRGRNKTVELTELVGDLDAHLQRYVLAINEVAAVTYGAGAALIDGQAVEASLPAGAVEELLTADVVAPIRSRLASLDALEVESAEAHLDPLRAFYRQRKTDHLGPAASRLAQLLCVSGVCDALPADTELPWNDTPAK